ncbi:MAG: hypothetical protein IH994_00120 [Proteobacteria bacterium]|nr:hypothetical protein [Pseudomonadota bacterium]
MSSQQDQVSKYHRVPEAGQPAQTEAWALLEAAKRLATAIVHGNDDDKNTKEVRKDALRLNWRLWTIFQAELTQDRPDLDPEIHHNMLTLCQFVDKHTVGALFKPTAEALSVLIDLNRNIASGLLSMPEDESAEAGESAEEEQAPPPTSIETEA